MCEEKPKLDRMCRLCSEESEGTCIFSEDGVHTKLEAKIRSYLHIEITREDNLPKNVCAACILKLDTHHQFVSLAINVQDKLYSLINKEIGQNKAVTTINGQTDDDDEEDEDNTNEEPSDEDEGNESNEEEGNHKSTDHSGSLLHSILTHGRHNSNHDSNSMKPEVTEVEVPIDPMLFLSAHDDISADADDFRDEMQQPARSNGRCGLETKESKPYQCSVCPRGFHSEISLQSHLWSHLSRKVLTNTDLNSRLRSQRKGCVYSANGVLHTVPLTHPYICPVCGRQISTKGNLKVHLETHRPKGKYTCDICGRIFKTQSNLYRHKEYHGGVQFTCEVCARVYPTKSTLRAHSITHSDLRPHQCPLCDKTFKRNQDLKFHINQHTGARPYKCPFCPKAFASSGNCFSHRKRMHPNQLEKYKEMTNGYVQ